MVVFNFLDVSCRVYASILDFDLLKKMLVKNQGFLPDISNVFLMNFV